MIYCIAFPFPAQKLLLRSLYRMSFLLTTENPRFRLLPPCKDGARFSLPVLIRNQQKLYPIFAISSLIII